MTADADAHPHDREETARLILHIGLFAAFLPPVLALGAYTLFKMGLIDWWTAYGRVLIGDGTLPLAMQACIVAAVAAGAGLTAALIVAPERLYTRAMLNVGLTALSLWGLMLLRG